MLILGVVAHRPTLNRPFFAKKTEVSHGWAWVTTPGNALNPLTFPRILMLEDFTRNFRLFTRVEAHFDPYKRF